MSELSSRRYEEALRVPPTWWLLGTGFAVTVWWVLYVAAPAIVAIAGGCLAAALVAAALASYGGVRVLVDETGLHAGRAHLPWQYVGEVESLDAQQTRRLCGVEADARAFLVVRPYCREAVKVSIDDTADVTPYWVISSRHPTRLARSLHPTSVQD